MKKIKEIQALIENTRDELNRLIVTDKTEAYYEKSRELDRLIEEYIDAEEQVLANA